MKGGVDTIVVVVHN